MKPLRRTNSLYRLGAVVVCSLAVPATAAAHIPEPATWEPMPLQLRLLQPGEFLDLIPVGPAQLVAAGAADPSHGGIGARSVIDTSRARFRGAFVEKLTSRTTSVKAVSVAAEFTSIRAAQDQVTAWHADEKLTPSAASIPSANESIGRTGLSVAFADGDFAYLIDTSWRRGTQNPPTRAQLIAAATELYRRVHQHPAS